VNGINLDILVGYKTYFKMFIDIHIFCMLLLNIIINLNKKHKQYIKESGLSRMNTYLSLIKSAKSFVDKCPCFML